jgi:hypothetical protein
VELGTDPDGDPIVSFVVLPAAPDTPRSAPKAGVRGLSSQQKVALEALTECTAEHGQQPPLAYGLPPSLRAVTLEQWKAQLFRVGVLERDDPDPDQPKKNPRAAFARLKTSLQGRQAIGLLDGMVWRT